MYVVYLLEYPLIGDDQSEVKGVCEGVINLDLSRCKSYQVVMNDLSKQKKEN